MAQTELPCRETVGARSSQDGLFSTALQPSPEGVGLSKVMGFSHINTFIPSKKLWQGTIVTHRYRWGQKPRHVGHPAQGDMGGW